jgi:dCTP deaminase
MTILSDGAIRHHIAVSNGVIEPKDELTYPPHRYLNIENLADNEAIGPASVDLRLSNQFVVVEGHKTGGLIRMDQPVSYDHLKQDVFFLAPRQFVLGSTIEKVLLPPTICASVTGRSSVGRLGLFVENAGWIDPGFQGNLTLELFNANDWPIRLEAGRRVIQIIFYMLDAPCQNPYQGKYVNHADGAEGSRIFEDREVKP